jgi:hypothetical protein
LAVTVIGESDHAQLNDLVPRLIKARCLGVDNDGDLLALTRATRDCDGTGLQAAEYTVVAGGLQHSSGALMIRSFESLALVSGLDDNPIDELGLDRL